MEIRPSTVGIYARQALIGMEKALDRFDDASVNRRPHGDRTNSAAGLIVHACAAAPYWFEHIGLGRPVERDRESEFTATATVQELRDLLATTADRLTALAADLETGPTVPDHELRVFLHGEDRSDGSLVLHALEELFQHLGHLELTADAIGSKR
ncbi:MAG: DinB family protein [Ilumatobacteraceae bacterium]